MRKLFTLAAAVLASFSLWAAEPDFESYDWTEASIAEVPGNHDGITIYSEGLGDVGNVSGHWYIPANQNLKATDDSWKFFGVSATSQIDSIAVMYCSNKKGDQTNIAWVAWGNETPSKDVIDYGTTAGTNGDKKWDEAIWETIDLSGIEAYSVYMSRSNREFYKDGTKIANFGGGKTINVLGFRVWLHETKTVVSTEESLTAVTINDVAISATDLASLVSNKYLFLADAYVTAPVVKFTKHTVITYDDASTKEKDEVIEVTSQPATTTWGASATINGNSYYVYTSKAASRTVTYMYGEQVLGTEIVAANGNPAEYAQYETMPLATFGGWYKDADLTQKVESMAAEVISADVTFYAKFSKDYLSKNVNIEQLVLDYGTKYDIKSALTAAGWAYENVDQLDTLNDLENKAARNEPYLGLKLKTKGAYIMGNLAVDGVLLVKFGNIGCDINVTAKGASVDANDTYKKEDLWREDDQAYVLPVYGFTEDVLLTITTTDKGTVVLKQLMLDELATVTLPAPGAYLVTCAESENGTIEATWPNKKYRTPVGETVTLTVTPAEGYKVSDVQVDGVSLNAVENVYSFVMPDQAVTVSASFERLPVVEYNITIAEMQNGTVTADKEKAAEGELVTLTVTPAEGYKIADVKVNDVSLNAVEGVYSFIMLAEEVTITATFVEDEPVIVTEYNITIAEMQNGSVSADKAQAAKGEIVTLTVTPAEGYKIADVKVNNVSLNAVEGVYSFEMPEEDVTITASFSSTEGFENIDASKQAVKVILNGQLLIKKGDKLFDAHGVILQ